MNIRPYEPGDRLPLLRICLLTADQGEDGSATFTDPWLVGRYFAEPYVVQEPDLCLVLVDTEGPCGYVLGTLDTTRFAAWFNAHWLPGLRQAYRDQSPRPGAVDGWLYDLLRQDFAVPAWAAAYPAHLHIDLLPRAQGRGLGRRLLEDWLALAARRGAPGVHLGVAPGNERAQAFYQRLGFEPLAEPGGATVWLGRRLEQAPGGGRAPTS